MILKQSLQYTMQEKRTAIKTNAITATATMAISTTTKAATSTSAPRFTAKKIKETVTKLLRN